jgi:hypothetical protein
MRWKFVSKIGGPPESDNGFGDDPKLPLTGAHVNN